MGAARSPRRATVCPHASYNPSATCAPPPPFAHEHAHSHTEHGLHVLQTVVERFNYEINMRVLVPFRRLINYLERAGMLSKENMQQVHAFGCIARPLCQYGLDLLTVAWNEHRVRGRKDCAHAS